MAAEEMADVDNLRADLSDDDDEDDEPQVMKKKDVSRANEVSSNGMSVYEME